MHVGFTGTPDASSNQRTTRMVDKEVVGSYEQSYKTDPNKGPFANITQERPVRFSVEVDTGPPA